MRVIAFIERRQRDVIRKILQHCGLWEEPRAPDAVPASTPPPVQAPLELRYEADHDYQPRRKKLTAGSRHSTLGPGHFPERFAAGDFCACVRRPGCDNVGDGQTSHADEHNGGNDGGR